MRDIVSPPPFFSKTKGVDEEEMGDKGNDEIGNGKSNNDNDKNDGNFISAWKSFTQGTSLHGLGFFYEETPFILRYIQN